MNAIVRTSSHNHVSARVALVTGAASDIGRAIALALAEDGCAVAVADRREDTSAEVIAEIEASRGEALAVQIETAKPRLSTGL